MEENTINPIQQPIQPNMNNNMMQQQLPNTTGILVMGIISIATCWCYGVVGITLGIISLILASKAKQLYINNPGLYSESSYKNMNAGRICAIIGLSLSALYIIIVIVYFLIIGAAIGALGTMPWSM